GANGSAVTVRFDMLERGDALEVGLYRVDDIYGTVNGVAAHDDGYALAALNASRAQAIVPGQALTLQGGALYAFYAVFGKQGHGEDSSGGSSSGSGSGAMRLAFSIAEANPDGRDRMQAS